MLSTRMPIDLATPRTWPRPYNDDKPVRVEGIDGDHLWERRLELHIDRRTGGHRLTIVEFGPRPAEIARLIDHGSCDARRGRSRALFSKSGVRFVQSSRQCVANSEGDRNSQDCCDPPGCRTWSNLRPLEPSPVPAWLRKEVHSQVEPSAHRAKRR